MTYGETRAIINAIDAGVEGNEMLQALRQQLFEAAIKYARLRTDWCMMALEERAEVDKVRSIAHDAFINACNILSRNMREQGRANEWRRTLGEDRKSIGDFACFLHALLGIRAR